MTSGQTWDAHIYRINAAPAVGHPQRMATATDPSGRDIELQRGPLPPAVVSPSSGGEHEAAGYGDTSTQIWKLYATESEKHDKDLIESWKSNTDSMLIFTGLFSSIVASFLLQTSTSLLPDTGGQTVTLLAQLVAQSNATAVPPSQILTQQTVPPSVIRINILMFLSLFLSVTSALVSTLIQQWAREYLQHSQPSAAPHKRGRVRAYLYDGLTRFQMRRLTYAVPLLLHLSVFLFFFALSDWLDSMNGAVGATARYCFVALLAIYMVLSVLPLIVKNAPYQTALTTPLQACVTLIQVSYIVLLQLVQRSSKAYETQKISGLFNRIHVGRARALMKEIKKRASQLDRSAMHWLIQELDDDDMDTFLSSLPGYIDSPLTDTKLVVEGLREDGVPGRIREHFKACVTSVVLSEDESMSRASACINSLRLISETVVNPIVIRPDLKDNDIQAIMEYLEPLCHVSNTSTALRASCIRSLIIREFLISFAHKDAEELQTKRFPDYLMPLYRMIRVWKTTEIDQWSHLTVILPAVREPLPSDQEMWADILYDGPLINLAVLAYAVLERAREQDIILDFAWKTFGTLLKTLGLGQVRASTLARARFNGVHLEARAGISRYEEGRAPITPLLDALGIVVTGLHITEVFAHPGLPKPKLPQRLIEAIFGRAQLRNSELLETFATHLPGFIEASTPEKAKSFMERLILEDKLWEQLHVNLSKCFQPQVPFHVKLRIVMAFFNILDVAFMV
ncbi:hypothetical protein BJV74DRAFT_593982 [Russula compacta]|nr:hypothetical protein BJV74DRAFT_593982 [Russula compacta]